MTLQEIGRSAMMSGPPGVEPKPYRYRLDRYRDSEGPAVCWVMLNPSTANGMVDDPTIRRVMGFTWAWGFKRAVIVNLYALRSPKPEALVHARDPIGPQNIEHVRRALGQADLVVCAWGSWWHNCPISRRPIKSHVPLIVHESTEAPVKALRLSKAGHPGHPLYVPGSTEPVDYGPSMVDVWR